MRDFSRGMIKELFASAKKLQETAEFLGMQAGGDGVFRAQSGLNLLPGLTGDEQGGRQQDHQNNDGRGEKPSGIAGLHGQRPVKIIEYQSHMSPLSPHSFLRRHALGESMRREGRQCNLFAIVLDDFNDFEYTHSHPIFLALTLATRYGFPATTV